MMEYSRHLIEYLNYWFAGFSKIVPEQEWGNKELAENYLQKYWLSEQEYFNIWKPIQDKIFINNKNLPELIYQPEFEMKALRGGCLFQKEDFEQLQNAMLQVGEEYFVVIQNLQEYTNGEPMFRMKFPTIITWDELKSGNYVSAVLLEMGYNEYFVFGLSGSWGKYSASDYNLPIDIIGVKTELAITFGKQFTQSQDEFNEIRKWLPSKYQGLIT